MITKQDLTDGNLGVKLSTLPQGEELKGDEDDGILVLKDFESFLSWTFKFYENLHMDLSPSNRDDLNKSITEKCNHLYDQVPIDQGREYPYQRSKLSDDADWSPLIEIRYIQLENAAEDPADALLVIHQTPTCSDGQVVIGRLFLPLRQGLFELIVETRDYFSDSSYDSASPNYVGDPYETLELDETAASDAVSRVKRAVHWLLKESRITVTEPPPQWHGDNEVKVPQLRCMVTPPKRFLHCPNSSYPESNKQRVCRVSFGGSGVEMLVLSCWYHGLPVPKGLPELRKIAMHGAKVIHHSLQLVDIKIACEEVFSTPRRSWLRGSSSKDAIVTVVDSRETDGRRRQNTIGWIREPHSGVVYLAYFVDTLGKDPCEVRDEILVMLSSLRTPPSSRRRSQGVAKTAAPLGTKCRDSPPRSGSLEPGWRLRSSR